VSEIQEFSLRSCVIPVLFVGVYQNQIGFSLVIDASWSIGFSNMDQKHRPQFFLHSYKCTVLVKDGSHSQIDILDSSLSIGE
jgi:hypothetical protein